MLKCKCCGADIPFDPGTQSYICPYCETKYTQEQLTQMQREGDIKAEEQKGFAEAPSSADEGDEASAKGTSQSGREQDFIEVITYTCPQCGGELYTTEETAATFCSYCGSSVLLESRVSKEMKPKYIIPFKITKEQAADIYKKKIKSAIFAPSYMRHMDIEKVRGIYMPYWTYGAETQGDIKVKKTEQTPVPAGMLVTEYEISANIYAKGDGIEFDASNSFPDDLSRAIAPFDSSMATAYQASYMSGFYADAGNVPAEQYEGDAATVMADIASGDIAPKLGVTAGVVAESLPGFDVNSGKAMYPVWFISARNKSNKKVSYAVINGQSGKIAADIPIDNKRLLIGTLAIAIPLFILLYFLITPTAQAAAIVVLILSAIGTFFAVKNMTGMQFGNGRKGSKPDLLWIAPVIAAVVFYFIQVLSLLAVTVALIVVCIIHYSKKAKRKKLSTGKKGGKYAPALVFSILSIVVCVAALIWNPVRDLYYYICMIISGICSAISYWMMFAVHNKDALRSLPQLGKRGGDR